MRRVKDKKLRNLDSDEDRKAERKEQASEAIQ